MKKIITVLLVGLMILGSSSLTFAEAPNGTLTDSSVVKEKMAEKLNLKKEFTEKFHEINVLRVEKNELQIQVVEKQDKLVDLYIAVKEAGNKEALKAAKEERQQIKEINNEIKALHEDAVVTRKAFKEALKNNDKEIADAEIEKLINIHSSINVKIKEKNQVLSTIIDILS